MKFDQLTKQQQDKVMKQVKKEYPSIFVKGVFKTANDKQYQKWLKDRAIQAVTNEMFNQQEEVA